MKKGIILIFITVFCLKVYSQEQKTSLSFFTEQSVAVSFWENNNLSPDIRLHRSKLESLDFSFHIKHYFSKMNDECNFAFYLGGGIKHEEEINLSIPVGIKYRVIPSNKNFNLITELVTVTDFDKVEFIPNLGVSYSF